MDAVEGVCLGKVRYAGMKRLDYWIDFDPSGLIKYKKVDYTVVRQSGACRNLRV